MTCCARHKKHWSSQEIEVSLLYIDLSILISLDLSRRLRLLRSVYHILKIHTDYIDPSPWARFAKFLSVYKNIVAQTVNYILK